MKERKGIFKLLTLSAMLVCIYGQALAQTSVFINEIHYDNTGTDSGEAIEVCGPAGTNLSGWDVVLYNGNGGGQYDSDDINCTIPDEGDGYGCCCINYPSNGIQNGAPDGMCLVDASDTVIQFLSYEGSLTATDGACNGVTSTDIGVEEPYDNPVGYSVKLCGSGSEYEDFAWTSPSASEFCTTNACQDFTGGDQAPDVASTVPEDDFYCVTPSYAPITINFTEAVTVSPGWYSIVGSSSGAISAVVTGGPQSYDLEPTSDFVAGETITVTIDKDFVQDQDGTPDNMPADHIFNFEVCDVTLIHDVQGSGSASPIEGNLVMIEGIVVADFQGTNLNTFFVEEEDADWDANSNTSEGVFIYDPAIITDVSMGDKVQVVGVVQEYYEKTEIHNITEVVILSSGNSLPTAVDINLPRDMASKETLEGMLVHLEDDYIVNSVYYLGRFGYSDIAPSRLYSCTNSELPDATPGSPCQLIMESNENNLVDFDDGQGGSNPDPIIWPCPELDFENTIRVGNTITTSLYGVLDWNFYHYHIEPVVANGSNPCDHIRDEGASGNTNSRPPETLTEETGECALRVATFNVKEHGNGNGAGGGFSFGPNDATEYTRQLDKLVSAICGMKADVVALQELENDGYSTTPPRSALGDLVNALNSTPSCGTWALVDYGTTDPVGGTMCNAFIYRSDKVVETGIPARLTTGEFASLRHRAPIAQTFQRCVDGGEVTVVNNHFRSRGNCGSCSGSDCDQGDGQACYNTARDNAATDLLTWIATNPTGQDTDNVLITGDLNAYLREDPVRTIEAASYDNLILDNLGTDAYTYVYQPYWADGLAAYSGALDHMLSSSALTPQVTGIEIWHINADEEQKLDYNLEYKSTHHQTSLYSPKCYRSSDHDPVIVNIDLPSDGCVCDVNNDSNCTPQDAFCSFEKYLSICPTSCGPCDDICCDVTGDALCTPADAYCRFQEYLGIHPNCFD